MQSMSLLGGLGACPPRKILKIKGFKIEDLQAMNNYVPVDYMYIANVIINTLSSV